MFSTQPPRDYHYQRNISIGAPPIPLRHSTSFDRTVFDDLAKQRSEMKFELRFIDCQEYLETGMLVLKRASEVLDIKQCGAYNSDDILKAHYLSPDKGWCAVSYPRVAKTITPNLAGNGTNSDFLISPLVLGEVCKAAMAKNISHVWIDELCAEQSGPERVWLITIMIIPAVFRYASFCLVLPAGLGRLASLYEETAYLRCTWALFEVATPPDRQHVRVLHEKHQRLTWAETEDVLYETNDVLSATSSFDLLLRGVFTQDSLLQASDGPGSNSKLPCIFGWATLPAGPHLPSTSACYEVANTLCGLIEHRGVGRKTDRKARHVNSVYIRQRLIWTAVFVRARENPSFASLTVLTWLFQEHYSAEFSGEKDFIKGDAATKLYSAVLPWFTPGIIWTRKHTVYALYSIVKSMLSPTTDGQAPEDFRALICEGFAHSIPRCPEICILPDLTLLSNSAALGLWYRTPSMGRPRPEMDIFAIHDILSGDDIETYYHPAFCLTHVPETDSIHLRFEGCALRLIREQRDPGPMRCIVAADRTCWSQQPEPRRQDANPKPEIPQIEMGTSSFALPTVRKRFCNGESIILAMLLTPLPNSPKEYYVQSWFQTKGSGEGIMQDHWWTKTKDLNVYTFDVYIREPPNPQKLDSIHVQ